MNKKSSEDGAARLPLSQRILDKLDIPVGTFGRISFIEATGNREINISGCVGLNEYSASRVVLELCDGFMTIIGSELELRSFSGGRVSVSGIISSIKYGRET
jgi:sporulation protein YqfC